MESIVITADDLKLPICPICDHELDESVFYPHGKSVVACSICKTKHHHECWQSVKGCGQAACSGTEFAIISFIQVLPEPEQILTQAVVIKSQDVAPSSCPYCQDALEDDLPSGHLDEVVICRRCRTPHHLRCWQRNGKCTVALCNSSTYETAPRVSAVPQINEPLVVSMSKDSVQSFQNWLAKTVKTLRDLVQSGFG